LTRDKERQKDTSARQKLESDLDGLRKVMAAKTSEDIKRQEVDKSREVEMTRLRSQVGQIQSELDAQRKKEQQLVSKVREEVEGLKQRHKTTDKELKAAMAELQDKEALLGQLQQTGLRAEERQREADAELASVKAKLSTTEDKLQTTTRSRDELETKLAKAQEDYNALEDDVLLIESEKTEWAGRMETISRQLTQESAKRQHFEQQLHDQQAELSQLRNLAVEVERELAKAEGDIKTRDSEIELLRSRENKTIVEHVYVLENAKKIAERETASQISENTRLNKILKGLEATKFRLQSELDDAKKQVTELKSHRSKQARAARASLSTEDKDMGHLLEDETRARQVAEARAAGLDRDLQELRRKMSTSHLSPSRPSAAEMKYAKMEDEINRFHQEHEALLVRNKQLEGEVLELRHRPAAPSTPNHHSNRADLLRGLQQSHDALGRDMSDQLRRLETPLTPSRKQSTLRDSDQNMDPALDLHASKTRILEREVENLKRQLELERGEKEHQRTRRLGERVV
jgi:myosin protein heavy chain